MYSCGACRVARCAKCVEDNCRRRPRVHAALHESHDVVSEELEEVPQEEKELDPLRRARICQIVGGVTFRGEVQEIERERKSGERLYRILYSDGDIGHLTSEEVMKMQI